MDVLAQAKSVIALQAQSIEKLEDYLTEDLALAVEKILKSKGRIIVTGIGKSALIGSKIVATLNSTGSPSIFMHAADAIHGDLGIVQQNDVVICISNSGNTPEIKALIPYIQKLGSALIAITGNAQGFLAEQSDFVLSSCVQQEACPNNLAPTTSTTAQLVMGDVLAVCLLKAKGFKSEDFAKYHPGGALGKKLYLTLGDLAAQNAKPKVSAKASFVEVVDQISQNRLGVVAVVDDQKLKGIITDGDVRRAFTAYKDVRQLTALDIMTSKAKTLEYDQMATAGVELFEKHKITQLLITKNGEFEGFVHVHDLLEAGIV